MTTGHDLAIALRGAYLALHRRSDAAFAPHGVTADQFVLLAALAQPELARRMPSDPSTVRAMPRYRHGPVERNTHPTDGRKRTVTLTAEESRRSGGSGRRASRSGWGCSARSSRGEAETLVGLLTRLAEALGAEAVPIDGAGTSHSSGNET